MTKIASAASVDRFLQRKLPEEQYRLLRGHEPCIVTIDETGKAIKVQHQISVCCRVSVTPDS